METDFGFTPNGGLWLFRKDALLPSGGLALPMADIPAERRTEALTFGELAASPGIVPLPVLGGFALDFYLTGFVRLLAVENGRPVRGPMRKFRLEGSVSADWVEEMRSMNGVAVLLLYSDVFAAEEYFAAPSRASSYVVQALMSGAALGLVGTIRNRSWRGREIDPWRYV